MITSEWPSEDNATSGIFIKRQFDFLIKMGVKVEIFHFRGKKNPLNYVKAYRNVNKIIASSTFDLIHAQFGQSVIPVIFSKLPIVVTFRGDDLQGFKSTSILKFVQSMLLKFVGRIAAWKADKIILVSSNLATYLPKNLRYEIVPSGLDLSVYPTVSKAEAREILGLPQKAKIVLFPCDPDNVNKGFDNARKAFEKVKEMNKDAILNVVWNKSHSEVLLNMRASDCLLFTSLHEGSPNIVKEAIASDLPVVSTDVGDVRDRISSIRGSFVVNDQSELAEKVLLILTSDYSTYSSRHFVEELDESSLNERVIKVYNSVMS